MEFCSRCHSVRVSLTGLALRYRIVLDLTGIFRTLAAIKCDFCCSLMHSFRSTALSVSVCATRCLPIGIVDRASQKKRNFSAVVFLYCILQLRGRPPLKPNSMEHGAQLRWIMGLWERSHYEHDVLKPMEKDCHLRGYKSQKRPLRTWRFCLGLQDGSCLPSHLPFTLQTLRAGCASLELL